MADGSKVYSVIEIMKYMNTQMAKDIVLSEVRVKGEVTGYSAPSSGHIYFKLKEKGVDGWGRPKDYILCCAKFNHNKDKKCKVKMKDGMVVTVIGKAAIFESRSEVQINVSAIFDNNEIGAAKAEYEMRRKRLAQEGLFDPEHKKPLPAYPKSIGIVTSLTGAVIHDIQAEVDKKNPYVQLYLYPSLVQGPGAAETIVRGITYFDQQTDVDLIIIGRGGGSEEDLGPFDEEILVRAIYNATKPIIAGTGHEIHFTLADYAADLRSSNPTMAASDAVYDVVSELNKLRTARQALIKNFDYILQDSIYRLDGLSKQLNAEMNNTYMRYDNTLRELANKLEMKSPEKTLEFRQLQLVNLRRYIEDRFLARVDRLESTYTAESSRLRALNPQSKLTGGFGYIEKDGVPVDSVKVVREGDEIRITINDGVIKARVLGND